MNTEELRQRDPGDSTLEFDAHEFDGLRDDLEQHAQTWLRRTDQFIRDNPWMCIGIAVAAGCVVACCLRSCNSNTADAESSH